MKPSNILHDKSYRFAVRIVKLSQYLNHEKKEFVLSKQVLRSGTAIGALVKESEFAQSSPDFINKLSIAAKEANETQYWISLLKDTEYITMQMHNSMNSDATELIKILTSIINTMKTKR